MIETREYGAVPNKIGEYITVEKWRHRIDNSFKGDVLEVTAIHYPYVVIVNRSCRYSTKPLPHSLDLREVAVVGLPDEYVIAMLHDGTIGGAKQ